MKKIYLFAALLGLTLLSGCASTPKTRFSEFYEISSHSKQIDVIIDSLVMSDIEGSKVGINKEKNDEAIELLTKTVIKELEARGYEPNIIYGAKGAYFVPEEKTEYFYSEKFKSTDEAFSGFEVAQEDMQWQSKEMKDFIQLLSEQAPLANKKPSKKAAKITMTPLVTPEVLKISPSNTLLYIKSYAGEISTGKSVGTGLATGLLSAALTGGAYIAVSTPVSGSQLSVIAYDKTANKIVWHNTGQAGKYKQIERGFGTLFKLYPTTEGKTVKKKSKKKSTRETM